MRTKPPSPLVAEAAVAAIRAAGGGTALAGQLGVTKFAVSQWRLWGIPAVRVGRVAEVTGIPVHELRPDLFSKQAAA